MSNRLSRARKGDKRPAVRQDEFVKSIRAMDEKVQRLQYMLMENIYHNRNIETKFNFFVQYLTKKGIIDDKDYKEYLDDINKKMKLAEEITKDESLGPEEKIAKAKQNDIPEEWVIEQKQAPEGTENPAAAEAEAEQEPESLIVTP